MDAPAAAPAPEGVRDVPASGALAPESANLIAPSYPRPSTAEAASPPSPSHAPRSHPANPYYAGIAAALLVVVLGNLAQIHVLINGYQKSADHTALASSALGDNDLSAAINGFWRVTTGQTTIAVGTDSWYWDASRIVADLANSDQHEITEFPLFTFLYADMHAHMMDMPFTLLALAWAVSYVFLAMRPAPSRRQVVGVGGDLCRRRAGTGRSACHQYLGLSTLPSAGRTGGGRWRMDT